MNEPATPDGLLHVEHGGRWGEDVFLPDTPEGRRLATRAKRLPGLRRVGRKVALLVGVVFGAAVGWLNNVLAGAPTSTAQGVVWGLTVLVGAGVGWWSSSLAARMVGEYREAVLVEHIDRLRL